MAEETQKPEEKTTASTATAITKDTLMKAQGKAENESIFDRQKHTIIKDSKYHKKGQVVEVHAATAEIFRAKGLIK